VFQAVSLVCANAPLRRGFLYLCAVIDLHTGYVLSWRLSNTITALWCCQVVEAAIDQYGRPQLINITDGCTKA
jgi:putative transposase